MCLLSMARHFSAIDCWANVLNPCGDSMMASRRETLCLIRPRLSIPNCFVRTYELAFSLYGRNSTTQRNGMPCAVIDFLFFFFFTIYYIFFFHKSYHVGKHSRRIHWNAKRQRKDKVSGFDCCAHTGLTAGLDMKRNAPRSRWCVCMNLQFFKYTFLYRTKMQIEKSEDRNSSTSLNVSRWRIS